MLLKTRECTLSVISILIYRSRDKSPDFRSKIICGVFLYTMCDIRIRRIRSVKAIARHLNNSAMQATGAALYVYIIISRD